MPKRIQHHLRSKGWRKPPGVVIVSRPSRWANPFKLNANGDNRHEVLRAYREHVEAKLKSDPGWLAPLRGRDLACSCMLNQPCHADTLLELANR
jgi:hypothetical protein